MQLNQKDKKKAIAVIPKDRCVACGVCVNHCPRNAISIIQGRYAQVDRTKCIGCSICTKYCPADIIRKEVAENEKDETMV